MSGFIFILNQDGQKVSKLLMDELVDSMKGKGPDRQSIHLDNNIGLGHTLFKTTFEAEYDKQPESIDGNIWIVSSARIDGRDELVKNLGMSEKINLNTTPDYKLILFAYRKWGEKCTKYLIGDFAFVIWNKETNKVFCARDHFGMHQLYYAFKDKTLIVSNSLYCMQKHPKISKTLNDKAVGGFLVLGDYTWMDKSITMFKDISVLESSHQLVFYNNSLHVDRYWDIPQDIPLLKYKKESDYIEHFMDIFKTAVRDRIRTSSVAVSMSGGMDSTTIAAVTKMIKDEGKERYFTLDAFTHVFDNLISCDERYYATQVAEKLKIPIHYFNHDNYNLLKPYVATTRPTRSLAPISWVEFRKHVVQTSRVILTGISTDNLLSYSSGKAAYNEVGFFDFAMNYIRLSKLYNKRVPLGTGLKAKFLRRGTTKDLTYYPSWLDPDFESKEHLKEVWEKDIFSDSSRTNIRHPNAYADLTLPEWNTDDYIYHQDFVVPEERDPFLDIRVVQFMFSLPPLPWFYNKHIIRTAMKNILPKEIISRPKTYLGDQRGALVSKIESIWIDQWSLIPELEKYMVKEKIPKIRTEDFDSVFVDHAIKPLCLNLWAKEVLYN